ncbi:MAG: 50S ribosomal protein L20 [Bacillota bacterium]
MPRVKRGNKARKRRKKVLKRAKGFFGSRSKLYRPANQAVMKALDNAYRDRKKKKRNFRKLWITRINAAARKHDMPYSRLINGLKQANIEIDRKMMAEMAVNDEDAFAELVSTAKEELNM